MRKVLILVLTVLVVLLSVVQGTAMQKKTTIPGLFFPSATPTKTNTPTNTMTPTVTLTPTRTQTPTPDIYAICATALADFAVLRKEELSIYREIALGMTSGEVLTRSEYETLEERLTTWTESYVDRVPKTLSSCTKNAIPIAMNDVTIHFNFTLTLYAMKEKDFASAEVFTREMQRIARENTTYELLLDQEMANLRQTHPQYSWPIFTQ